MTILRQNKDSLMSVLEAFLHDPVVDWEEAKRRKDMQRLKKSSANSRRKTTTTPVAEDDGSAFIRQLAMAALTPIDGKLAGSIPKVKTVGTNSHVGVATVPNQVEMLIREATSTSNLAAMYVGWASTFPKFCSRKELILSKGWL